MYEEFYRLDAKPFSTVPDPDFLFWSESHDMTFTMLRYGLMSRALITVVTGEIGCGKTTLLRQLIRETPDELTIGLVSNMQAGKGALLHWVMSTLDEPIDDCQHIALFRRFEERVVAEYAAGRRVVLIFDEAQNMDVASLEELRLLSNINADKDELLQLVLIGQPQLRDLLARPELEQFSQRIASTFHLEPLSAFDVKNYIEHRLGCAGAKWNIFSPGTYPIIYKATGGVPRLVNILSDLCLVYGYAADSKVVTEELLLEFLNNAARMGIYTQFKPVTAGAVVARTGT